MIVGIGTDIVEVERIRSLLEKNGETFLRKILRPDEIKTCCGSEKNQKEDGRELFREDAQNHSQQDRSGKEQRDKVRQERSE